MFAKCFTFRPAPYRIGGMHAGKIPFIQVKRKILYRESEVLKWLEIHAEHTWFL
jgi:hypothetical protein